ncbi:MAG: C40 family peptidase [Spirochaetia bacterium]|nr:C40 family peptidase [Spirochaetia bacterium]
MLNTDYGYGRQEEGAGFDCSGLSQAAYAKAGIKIPRMVKDQYAKADKISTIEAKPGDLVFYTTYAPGATHVGIYIGNNRFIHAPSTGKKVSIVEMNNPYWKSRFICFGSFF